MRLRVLGGALACALVLSAPAAARDFTVTSFDGTEISAHFFPAGAGPAPTVLNGPGWGLNGATDASSGLPAELIGAGYNVLTWDPRGFGASGGEANVDSIDFEARDAQALIDYLAQQPEAQLDGPGDPRVGMAGGSYGGGIQWVTAALDPRVDVITPEIAWHSLTTALYKHDTFKAGWGSLLCGLGAATGNVAGIFNGQTGSLEPHVYASCVQGLATGKIDAESKDWFAARGPDDAVISRVTVPSLVIEGTVDTLFTLDEAITNQRLLRGDGVPTKMMWYCSGHGVCLTPTGLKGYVDDARLKWFDRYLKRDRTVDTGAGFEWIDQTGVWHQADHYPLDPAGSLVGSGKGTLPLVPVDVSGALITATVAVNAVNVDIEAPSGPGDLVGAPQLEVRYSGTAADPDARVFGQIVDTESNLVLGNQATPIPLVLDGQPHVLTQSLEAIAYAATPASRLRLQIAGNSTLYGAQRNVGSVDFEHISVSLPLGKDPAPVTTRSCTPRLKPRRARRTARGKVRLRLTLRCAGKPLSVTLKVRAGKRVTRTTSGSRIAITVGAKRKRLVVRYRFDGRVYRKKIKLISRS